MEDHEELDQHHSCWQEERKFLSTVSNARLSHGKLFARVRLRSNLSELLAMIFQARIDNIIFLGDVVKISQGTLIVKFLKSFKMSR